ncbi:FAD-dependent oxidoreductase, partial [Streptomyces mirabilis]|uniref:FAD-dependent oxidoreductase n=1 Tax=Streptomyces mirabilis TaxID=68239 RepID=UPI0036E9FDCE
MTIEHAQQSQEHNGHSRRRFLTATGGAVAGFVGGEAIGALGAAGGAAAASSGKRVAVLGGGVSGLSAAHELAERGYEVTVYEYYDVLGGKARSMDVPGTGTG